MKKNLSFLATALALVGLTAAAATAQAPRAFSPPAAQLERRVSRLEDRVAALEAAKEAPQPQAVWQDGGYPEAQPAPVTYYYQASTPVRYVSSPAVVTYQTDDVLTTSGGRTRRLFKRSTCSGPGCGG